MTSAEIRQAFLDFFASKQHQIIPSSSLIPGNDATLLFTNAGMVQFKETFLGQEKRPYARAASSQRCVRAGGKHNDLENVGYTARHHTFFEMLGNFSFGDYFKREAIHFAWEFLTQVLKIPAARLWVTVFLDDDESAAIWVNEIGIDPQRISRCGEKDNFWSMGDTGPCGPCSEIFYDHGAEVPGGPPGSADADADRYIEIWNLVFMQFDRAADGSLTSLPKPCVDTGMGLERISAVMQKVHSNYEIDIFQTLIKATAKLVNSSDLSQKSLRVIADHIRSAAFLILDGVIPSNEGRGYVLRRIIRRAIRHGYHLGASQAFFNALVPTLTEVMGTAYPDLIIQQSRIMDVLAQEEEQFAKTLEQGIKILEQQISTLKLEKTIPGEVLFRLYDTYGFPLDLTADIARERGLEIDEVGFERCMQEQRRKSQAASQFASDYSASPHMDVESLFQGYEHLSYTTRIAALLENGVKSEVLTTGAHGQVILQETPFYAESGGQIGDQGWLGDEHNVFIVNHTQKIGGNYLHIGYVEKGEFRNQQTVIAHVDSEKRQATALNHSATHLLHAALRQLLGEQLSQKGSLVTAERLRFDFSYNKPLSSEQLQEIEARVNQQIRLNSPIVTTLMSPEAAIEAGAMALFGEKYSTEVRVLSMGEFSKELCGGTHAARTGDIGFFKIINETGIAAGIRRIEAISGQAVQRWVSDTEHQLMQVGDLLKARAEEILPKLQQILQKQRELEKVNQQLQAKLALNLSKELAQQAQRIDQLAVLALKIEDLSVAQLPDLVDKLKDRLGSAVIVLALTNGKAINLIAGVTKDYMQRLPAGQLINFVAQQVGGKGGGKPELAKAAGDEPQHLATALASVTEWVRQHLTTN